MPSLFCSLYASGPGVGFICLSAGFPKDHKGAFVSLARFKNSNTLKQRYIWKEQNSRTLRDREHMDEMLKDLFLKLFFDWVRSIWESFSDGIYPGLGF